MKLLFPQVTCFVPVFFDASWTDNRPDYAVNMTFSDQGSVHSETTITRQIDSPISKFHIIVKEPNKRPATLYNVTARLCELNGMINKVPMIKAAHLSVTKQSNLTFECPLKPGFYVMGNMRIGSRNPFMALIFRPRVSYTICGGLYEEKEDKSLVPLSTYNINFKVVKKSCKE